MTGFVSGDLYLRVVLVLAAILAVLAGVALLTKRFGLAGKFGGAGRRLGVSEAASIDAKRRLVLVRRDEVEHLLLIGPEGATVVETGIRMTPQHDTMRHDTTRPDTMQQGQSTP